MSGFGMKLLLVERHHWMTCSFWSHLQIIQIKPLLRLPEIHLAGTSGIFQRFSLAFLSLMTELQQMWEYGQWQTAKFRHVMSLWKVLTDHLSYCLPCMGVDPWVDRGTCPPYFLKWRGRPMFCPPPTFFGSRHCLYCTAMTAGDQTQLKL